MKFKAVIIVHFLIFCSAVVRLKIAVGPSSFLTHRPTKAALQKENLECTHTGGCTALVGTVPRWIRSDWNNAFSVLGVYPSHVRVDEHIHPFSMFAFADVSCSLSLSVFPLETVHSGLRHTLSCPAR